MDNTPSSFCVCVWRERLQRVSVLDSLFAGLLFFFLERAGGSSFRVGLVGRRFHVLMCVCACMSVASLGFPSAFSKSRSRCWSPLPCSLPLLPSFAVSPFPSRVGLVHFCVLVSLLCFLVWRCLSVFPPPSRCLPQIKLGQEFRALVCPSAAAPQHPPPPPSPSSLSPPSPSLLNPASPPPQVMEAVDGQQSVLQQPHVHTHKYKYVYMWSSATFQMSGGGSIE